ncbi:MAG: hypothetical protein H7Z72_20340, partial [Bacteroidetes bacterium]|nr:hypothetical protein [Fibrella sp.]
MNSFFRTSSSTRFGLNGPRLAALFFLFLLFGSLAVQGQTNWTGGTSTDWNTAGNWASGTIPTATDDVVIPSASVNQPILSTTATAKSVEVQSGASLSITAAGSLTINGSKNVGGFTAAFANRGSTRNAGGLVLGNTANVGAAAIFNQGSFANVGGTIRMDRTSNQAINNNQGTFTNTGTIIAGEAVSVGSHGIFNLAT